MSWINDIVQVKPDPPPVDDGVNARLGMVSSSASYNDYQQRCV